MHVLTEWKYIPHSRPALPSLSTQFPTVQCAVCHRTFLKKFFTIQRPWVMCCVIYGFHFIISMSYMKACDTENKIWLKSMKYSHCGQNPLPLYPMNWKIIATKCSNKSNVHKCIIFQRLHPLAYTVVQNKNWTAMHTQCGGKLCPSGIEVAIHVSRGESSQCNNRKAEQM